MFFVNACLPTSFVDQMLDDISLQLLILLARSVAPHCLIEALAGISHAWNNLAVSLQGLLRSIYSGPVPRL